MGGPEVLVSPLLDIRAEDIGQQQRQEGSSEQSRQLSDRFPSASLGVRCTSGACLAPWGRHSTSAATSRACGWVAGWLLCRFPWCGGSILDGLFHCCWCVYVFVFVYLDCSYEINAGLHLLFSAWDTSRRVYPCRIYFTAASTRVQRNAAGSSANGSYPRDWVSSTASAASVPCSLHGPLAAASLAVATDSRSRIMLYLLSTCMRVRTAYVVLRALQ